MALILPDFLLMKTIQETETKQYVDNGIHNGVSCFTASSETSRS